MSNRRKKLPDPSSGKAPARQSRPAVGQRYSTQIVRMEYLPPALLAQFNEVIPGSARELLDNTLAESAHRRAQQDRALEANIAIQRQALAQQQEEMRNAFKSDVSGQRYGFIWNMSCLAVAGALAWFNPDLWKVAVAVAAMPAFTFGVKVVIDSRHWRKNDKAGDSRS